MDKITYFIDTKLPWFSIPQNITIGTIIEIGLLALIFYYIYSWIKDRKAYTLLKGILIIFIFYIISYIFNFYVFLWFFDNTFQIIIISVAVIFQPELRKALESIGNQTFSIMPKFNNKITEKYSDETIEELIKAIKVMSNAKTGALILLEQSNSLIEYEQTGIYINADISNQLLINIFEHNTPLHDGALIIKNNRITAATCYLPLTENKSLNKSLGTRHRAAVGASEITDAIIIIVSEETGKISVAKNGKLQVGLTEPKLRKILQEGQQKEILQNKKILNVKEVLKNVKTKRNNKKS